MSKEPLMFEKSYLQCCLSGMPKPMPDLDDVTYSVYRLNLDDRVSRELEHHLWLRTLHSHRHMTALLLKY